MPVCGKVQTRTAGQGIPLLKVDHDLGAADMFLLRASMVVQQFKLDILAAFCIYPVIFGSKVRVSNRIAERNAFLKSILLSHCQSIPLP